jgi:hypothetical protein
VCFDLLYNFYPKLFSVQGEYKDITNDPNINSPKSIQWEASKSETNKIFDRQLMPDAFNRNEISRGMYMLK